MATACSCSCELFIISFYRLQRVTWRTQTSQYPFLTENTKLKYIAPISSLQKCTFLCLKSSLARCGCPTATCVHATTGLGWRSAPPGGLSYPYAAVAPCWWTRLAVGITFAVSAHHIWHFLPTHTHTRVRTHRHTHTAADTHIHDWTLCHF